MKPPKRAVRVSGRLELHGQRDGDYMVATGGCLIVRGQFRGDAQVFSDGQMWIFGELVGSVTNAGGRVVVIGTVTGTLDTFDGKTQHLPDVAALPLTLAGGELKVLSPPQQLLGAWHHVGRGG